MSNARSPGKPRRSADSPGTSAVTYDDFERRLVLEYWSASAEFIQLWCEQITSDATFDLYNHRPRHLVGDHQDLSDLPQDVKVALLGNRQSDLPVDRIAAWFPYNKSNNIRLFDGERTYLGSGMPPRIHIKVLRGGFDSLPALMAADWPAAHWNRSEVSAIPPLADTPPGCLTIRTGSGDFRDEFTIDPARDFIAVRHLEWQKNAGKWDRNDRRAVRFKQLASGAWYVTAWELRRRTGLAEAEMVPKPDDKDGGELHTQRNEISPVKPGEFPKDIFDGAKFIEAAKKAGAVIKADAKNEREAGDCGPTNPGCGSNWSPKCPRPTWRGRGALKNLKSVVLLSTTVTDAGLAHLEGLTGLRDLSLNLDPRGSPRISGPSTPATVPTSATPG